MPIGITALGHALPRAVTRNADLPAAIDTSDEWIRTRTGIHQRHLAEADETTSHLAIRSVDDLIRHAGPDVLHGVDLIIVATATPDASFPSTAALIQHHFQLQATAYDLSNACAGFVTALNVAVSQIQSGSAHKALVIGAETFSTILNWQDRSTAVLFGDGAGAALIEPVPAPYGFQSHVSHTDGAGASFLHVGANARTLPSGEPLQRFIVQNGREVFKFATRAVPEAVEQAVSRAHLSLSDITTIVPHQANARIISAAAERLGVPLEKFVVTVDRHANTGAASIPLALHQAQQDGRFKPGDRVVLVGYGGGLSWAASVLSWSISPVRALQPMSS